MKAKHKYKCFKKYPCFISHMVQMKVVPAEFLNVGRFLYIPHGSDESSTESERLKCYYKLYIPHGSDERFYLKLTIIIS